MTKVYTAKQKYRCPICKCSLAHKAGVLDHSHINGSIRAVLCNSCNISEGKVRFALMYRSVLGNLIRRDPVAWLRNLADYLENHDAKPTGIIHPTFDVKTGKQKPIKRASTTKK